MKKTFSLLFSLFVFANLLAQVPGACGPGGKNPSSLNGSGSLGLTYQNSACGLNYVQTSQLIQTRSAAQATPFNANGTGLPTTLAISGIPPCATIVRAYVWYLVSYLSTQQASSVVITNPVPATSTYPATNIGNDQDKCWGEAGTVNYRADVTAAITGNGNYGINITGITGTGGNFFNWYDQIDGLTLMIIYQDNAASYQGSLVIWDGDMTGVGNNYTQTMTGINACGNSTAGNAFVIVSDMQSNVNSNMHPSTLNGTTITTFPNDFYNFDVTNTTVTSGQATSAFGTDGSGGDCFDWAVMGLYYQTTTCTTCIPSAVSLTVTPTPSTCNAPNGGATATATTSNPPLTYLWSPGGQTTASISNLAAGNYTCTVTSASGCSTVQTFSISASVGPLVTFTTTPTKCFGSSDGSVALTASGGTSPYTYIWSTTPVQTIPAATGLMAGTYSVSVGDASGCSATYTVAITQPTALAATASVVANASCNGSSDGSAIVNASGGTGAYTYGWTPSGQNTQAASNLAAGNHNIVVTDANGCTIVSSVSITQPTALNVSTTSTPTQCGINDGTVSATSSGGIAPYTYQWLTTPVQSTSSIAGLGAGVYTIIVVDANGCNQTQNVTVGGGEMPVADFLLSPEVLSTLDPLVLFTDLSTGNPTIWSWNFGDTISGGTNISSSQHPSHSYPPLAGTYCITLAISTPAGVCADTIIKCIRMEEPFTFYMPNAFTPEGNGLNELFYGKGQAVKEYNIWLFDRWGNMIWDCHQKGNSAASDWEGAEGMPSACKWDGKVVKGGMDISGGSKQLAQEDVFMWKVVLTDMYDIEHKFIGHFSMIK